MRRAVYPALALSAALLTGVPVLAAAPSPTALRVTVEGLAENDAAIPAKFALCKATDDGKSTGGENTRPTISWQGAPSGTKSFAVVVMDPDVPASFADAGKDGKVVKHDAKRQLFYHWALADIPATVTTIPGGASSKAPAFGTAATGSLEKYLDDATQYGGPCPPWNDERLHHYHFTVYALDVAALTLPDAPSAKDVEKAVADHVVASGTVTGTYTLNTALRAQ